MFDLLKQTIFASVGLASLTRDKAEQLATEIARRAKLSEQESKEFQADLASRADQARQELQAEIDRRIDHAFIQLGILKAGMKREGEAARAEFRAAMDAGVDEVLQRMGVARSDDLEALTSRLDALERKLAAK
jgi:polyhydroxyalkanoate synthesis regulator phasin